jgi:hypothetical protein
VTGFKGRNTHLFSISQSSDYSNRPYMISDMHMFNRLFMIKVTLPSNVLAMIDKFLVIIPESL